MPYDQAPMTPLTPEQAVAAAPPVINDSTASVVPMAGAFTDLELVDGVVTASGREAAIGKEKRDLLLELNPFENLAVWLGTPLSFDNEGGRQIRQHVHTVSVIGPFGVGG